MDFDCVWLEKKPDSLHVMQAFTDTKTQNRLQSVIGGNSDTLYCPLVERNAGSCPLLMSPGWFLVSAPIVVFWCGS